MPLDAIIQTAVTHRIRCIASSRLSLDSPTETQYRMDVCMAARSRTCANDPPPLHTCLPLLDAVVLSLYAACAFLPDLDAVPTADHRRTDHWVLGALFAFEYANGLPLLEIAVPRRSNFPIPRADTTEKVPDPLRFLLVDALRRDITVKCRRRMPCVSCTF